MSFHLERKNQIIQPIDESFIFTIKSIHERCCFWKSLGNKNRSISKAKRSNSASLFPFTLLRHIKMTKIIKHPTPVIPVTCQLTSTHKHIMTIYTSSKISTRFQIPTFESVITKNRHQVVIQRFQILAFEPKTMNIYIKCSSWSWRYTRYKVQAYFTHFATEQITNFTMIDFIKAK